MVALLARLHGLLFRLVLWLVRLPLAALWALLLSVLALLGEEVRRWVGIAMAGLLIVVMGKVTLGAAPASIRTPVVLAVLAMLSLWALTLRRAARITMANNLVKVRQRQSFRELRGEVGQLGGRLEGLRGGVARRAKGTRAEVLFPSNREDRAKQAAAEQAAQERAAAEAAEVARRMAEAERVATEQAARLPTHTMTATRRARRRARRTP